MGCLARMLLQFATSYLVGLALRTLFLTVFAATSPQATVLAWALIVLIPELLIGPITDGRLQSPIGNQIYYYKIGKRVASGDLPIGLVDWHIESNIPIEGKAIPQPSMVFLWIAGLLTFLLGAVVMTTLASCTASLLGRPFVLSFTTLLPLEILHLMIRHLARQKNMMFAPAGKHKEFDALLKWERGEWMKTTKAYNGIFMDLMRRGPEFQAETPLEDIERLKRLREKAKEKAQESGQTEESGGPGGV